MKRSKKRFLRTTFGVILAFLLLAAVTIGIISSKNVKAMNHCVDAVLAKLQENYTITPRDIGEYTQLRIYGIMNFDVEQFDIENIGNLSIMRMNIGLMQMATVVITPTDKNLPLLSTDYMYILSNRKAYLEFYDVVAQKDDKYHTLLKNLSDTLAHYDNLETIEVSETWYAPLLTVTAYKGGSFSEDNTLEQMLLESLETYLADASLFPLLSDDEKAEKQSITLAYTDGLIEKGGISTDIFKNELGKEDTKKFFDQIFFGTLTE